MSGTIWTKFYWSDWQSEPALRLCSFAARGLWMDMLCIAAAHDPIGYVAVAGRALSETDIARMTGGLESEVCSLLGELDRNGVFSRDRQGRIYSRRMVSDARKAAIAKKNGKNGGNPSLGNQTRKPASVNPPVKPPLKPHKPSANYPEGDRADALSPQASEKAKASPIPDGFPSESDIEAARGWIAKAGVRLDPAEHARRFRNYNLSHGRELADWGAGWFGWIEIEIGKAPALPPPDAAPPVAWEGPPEVWDLAVARKSLDWARSYIGGCVWTGGALETRSLTAAKAIKAAIGDDLNDRGWTIVHAGQADQAAA